MPLFGRKPSQRTLRDKLDKAQRRERFNEALAILDKLQMLEPSASRWPHKRGDLLRRIGRRDEAIHAYEQAVDLYAREGFLARAVAMAKTIVSLDPKRTDALQRVEPEAARELHRKQRPHAVTAVADCPTERKSILEAARDYSSVCDTDGDEAQSIREDEDSVLEVDLSELEVEEREPVKGEVSSSRELPRAEQLAKLPLLPLFAEVPRRALAALIESCELVELSHGETVVRIGEPADALYGIVEGSVRVLVPGSVPQRSVVLAEGDVLGEACLLDDEPRHADVVVEGMLVALRIPKAVLNDLVQKYPAIEEVLLEMLARRLLSNLLHTSALFMEFDDFSKCELGRAFEILRVSAGTRLIESGKICDGLFLPLTGKFRIDPPPGAECAASGYGPVFGQESLISRRPSQVTVYTETELIVLRLPKEAFTKIAMQYPTLLARMSEMTGTG
jgi:CRP-like cAMP-binding protein